VDLDLIGSFGCILTKDWGRLNSDKIGWDDWRGKDLKQLDLDMRSWIDWTNKDVIHVRQQIPSKMLLVTIFIALYNLRCTIREGPCQYILAKYFLFSKNKFWNIPKLVTLHKKISIPILFIFKLKKKLASIFRV